MRPASGFDADLKVIARLSRHPLLRGKAVSAPASEDPALQALIGQLRAEGERVIVDLDSTDSPQERLRLQGCDRRLVQKNGVWQVHSLA